MVRSILRLDTYVGAMAISVMRSSSCWSSRSGITGISISVKHCIVGQNRAVVATLT